MSLRRRIALGAIGVACAFCCIAGCTPQQDSNPGSASAPNSGSASEQASESTVTPEQQAVIDGEEGITPGDINEDAYPGK